MGGAGDDGLPRQLGAVEEEQQGDAGVGDPAESCRHLALAGEQGGDGHGGDQGQGEVVGEQAWAGHGTNLAGKANGSRESTQPPAFRLTRERQPVSLNGQPAAQQAWKLSPTSLTVTIERMRAAITSARCRGSACRRSRTCIQPSF
ncbi:hypothetical protein D3C81_1046460 [compost metagenome]